MTEAIELDRVGLLLGGSRIYEDISFSVEDREFVCLLGPSGCGKSTALRLVGDLLDVQSGRVRVNGKPPSEGWSDTAFVFQSPRLLPWKTALENAAFGVEMRAPEVPVEDRHARARKELQNVGLGADLDKLPAMLSGGEKQRVAIARALALDPAIILMDEPFSALDHTTRAKLRQQIVDLWSAREKAVLFVTHDIDEALFLADRIVVLSRKPTRVAEIMRVNAPRPRDPTKDSDLARQRERLIELLEETEHA